MKRGILGAFSLAAVLFAASPALASGGSGGGGGGTGGGGGGVAAPCGNLTVTTGADSVGFPQVQGTTEKTCDGLTGLVIRFEDVAPVEGCTVYIPNFYGATYFKYGVRPPSRYASYLYATGCPGTSHTIKGTLSLNGVDVSTASTAWTA